MTDNDDEELQRDIEAIRRIDAVRTMLDVVCRSTGMGFAAVSRVTKERWIACSVLDQINFGLASGGELEVESTICDEIRDTGCAVVIDHVDQDPQFREHHTPARYHFQSYISIPIRRRNGVFFGTLCAIDPWPRKLNTPEVVGMFQMFADLIAFHLDAIDREDANNLALAAERRTAELREQFIAILGHDLRNPLNSIQAGAALLRRAPEKAAQVLPLIERSVDRMTGLVDDTLDFARGRLGKGVALDSELVKDLGKDLQQVIDELRVAQPDRVIEAIFTLDRPIRCDRRRIAQLLSNLLANALTYGGPNKPVVVSARIIGDLFEISVVNSGEPIPVEAMANLFQPFFRASTRSSAQGLGLGLFIVAEIARAHGGTVTATSTVEQTQFDFKMSVSKTAAT
jgi:signal transduction histidine kinase